MLFDIDLFTTNLKWLDFTIANENIQKVDLTNTDDFSKYVFNQIPKGKIGIGGWLEDRIVYSRSEHFQSSVDARTIHLGLDFWVSAGTSVQAPKDGRVHSFANNDNFGDYGPTIVLEHDLSNGNKLYSLYGHLSLDSLENLDKGQEVKKGQNFCTVGSFPENGDWPPHLHFQVMNSMEGKEGDFPGVCSKTDLSYFKTICLNPIEFLGIKNAPIGV